MAQVVSKARQRPRSATTSGLNFESGGTNPESASQSTTRPIHVDHYSLTPAREVGALKMPRRMGTRVSERVRFYNSLSESTPASPTLFVPGEEFSSVCVRTLVDRIESGVPTSARKARSGSIHTVLSERFIPLESTNPLERTWKKTTDFFTGSSNFFVRCARTIFVFSPNAAQRTQGVNDAKVVWTTLKTGTKRGAKWVWTQIKSFFRPYSQLPGLLSPDPIKRAQAKDAGVEISGQIFRAIRTCGEVCSNVVQWTAGGAVVYFKLVPLGWATAAFSALYGAATTVQAVTASKRLRRLQKLNLRSDLLRPTLDFTRTQLKRRVGLKSVAATAAFMTTVGGAICLATLNMWNPVGWAFMGVALALSGGWTLWKIGSWIYTRVKGTQSKVKPIDLHVNYLFNALGSDDQRLKEDAVDLLVSLGIEINVGGIDNFLQDRMRAMMLVKGRLSGAEDFFI